MSGLECSWGEGFSEKMVSHTKVEGGQNHKKMSKVIGKDISSMKNNMCYGVEILG